MRRGGILVIVLIVMAIISLISVQMFEKSENTLMSSSLLFQENQGSIYASTVFEAVKSLMSLDDSSYDGEDDAWLSIPPVPVDIGTLIISMRPLDSRIPINSLNSDDPMAVERVEKATKNIFISNDINIELFYAIRDWISPSDAEPYSSLVYGRVFSTSGNSYVAKHGTLETFAEIELIPEVRPWYSELVKYMTAGDKEPKININFASKEVISSFLPELAPFADEIISKRSDEPFKTKEVVYSIMGSEHRDQYQAILPYFDVKSSSFYVKIELDTGDFSRYYHMLMRRISGRLVLEAYIEGSAKDYF